MPSIEVRDLTPVAATVLSADDRFIFLDVSQGAGSSCVAIEADKLLAGIVDVLGNKLVIPQIGGTPGTDQIEISHDGAKGVIACKDGTLTIVGLSGVNTLVIDGFSGDATFNASGILTLPEVYVPASGDYGKFGNYGMILTQNVAGVGYGWGSIGGSTSDTKLVRSIAKVIGLTDGSSAGATINSPPLLVSITADQNNWNPGVARHYVVTTDAERIITGLSIGQVNGQEFYIKNGGENNLVLAHESGSSTAANRFDLLGDTALTLGPGECAFCVYYGGSVNRFSAWQLGADGPPVLP